MVATAAEAIAGWPLNVPVANTVPPGTVPRFSIRSARPPSAAIG